MESSVRRGSLLLVLLMMFGAGNAAAHGGGGGGSPKTLAYVANALDNTVSVINTATNTVVATIPVGLAPAGVAATPNGAFVYVVNNDAGTVSVISVATNAVVATVPVGWRRRTWRSLRTASTRM